jgi:hypothetical protein
MRRLSLAVLAAAALAIGAVGCVTFCDECDNFPAPANVGTSMMPGTYTGPSPTVGGSRSQNEAPKLVDDQAPAASNAPTGTNFDSSVPTPPPAPATNR